MRSCLSDHNVTMMLFLLMIDYMSHIVGIMIQYCLKQIENFNAIIDSHRNAIEHQRMIMIKATSVRTVFYYPYY